jgi:hypothetical protein
VIGYVILGIWVACVPSGFRLVMREWMSDFGGPGFTGAELAMGFVMASIFGALLAPFIVAHVLLVRIVGSRGMNYNAIGERLAGKPPLTPRERITQLERRNAHLERELGLTDNSGGDTRWG